MEDKALTENRFIEILDKREEDRKKKLKKGMSIFLILYICVMVVAIVFVVSIIRLAIYNQIIKTGVAAFDKITLEKNTNYVVEWFYQCPSYSTAFYNCPHELSFENMTGQYCNKTILCQNNYTIHLKQNRTI